jgi:hypothetical protein
LNRNTEDTPARALIDDMRVRVSLGSYRLFYISDGEEVIFRAERDMDEGTLATRVQAREEGRRKAWVAKYRE